MSDEDIDSFADHVGSFFDKGDFFGALYRANVLDQIGGVDEFDAGQRRANLLEGTPGYDPFRCADQPRQTDHAGPRGANFLQSFDDRLAIGTARWPDVLDPVLCQSPPLDFVGAANDRGDIAF